jgi:hypothetical protein
MSKGYVRSVKRCFFRPIMDDGGHCIDYHSLQSCPENWFRVNHFGSGRMVVTD